VSDTADRAARWAQVQEVFHAALERPPAERTRHLDEACGDDAELRAEVELLLAAHEGPGVLGEPAARASPLGLDGDRFGPYRILRPLGRGGMGAVYLAEREGPGFTQVVALKLLHAGVLLPEMDERFARERRILARLEHPGIARLIDGGYTPTHQPYLAMEFVEGTPLTEYAVYHRLTIRDRIRLFLEVCDAVQYAHQRLVIHRDLKPSNILVPAGGHPKLLDFGIATLGETDDGTTATRTGAWFTPSYASPEQVRRERVTTLSDLYGLGILLYELLAGVRPYDVTLLSPSELERVVCWVPCERPSVRATDPRVARVLRGDLDTIVLKALAKEPDRRYGSVQELADDLRRHLEHERVHARPDSLSYRATTFLRRNGAAVAAAILVMGTLGAGLAATAWQARMAGQARDRAEAALRQSQEVTEFLIGLFEESDPLQAPVDPALATAILQRGVARAGELAGEPAVQARLLDALGMIFVNLGRYEDAHRLVGQALGIRLATHGTDHVDVAESLRHVARVNRALASYTAAETLYRQALDIQRRLLGPDHPAVAETMLDLGFLLPYLGRPAESEAAYRDALALQRRVLPPDDPAIGRTIMRVAGILRLRGQAAPAESVGREGLAFLTASLGPDHPEVAGATIAYADYVAQDSTRYAEAEALYRRGLAIQRQVFGDRHMVFGHGMGNLAELLAKTGRYAEADSLLRGLLAMYEQIVGPEHEQVAATKEAIADLLAAQGRYDEAIALRRDGVAIWRKALGEDHPVVGGSLLGLARLYEMAGNDSVAEELMLEGLALRRRGNAPRHPLVGLALVQVGELNTRQKDDATAERQLLEAWDILQALMDTAHPQVRQARAALVRLYEAWNRPEDAARYRGAQ
jgi:serine/threonine-protein kinase